MANAQLLNPDLITRPLSRREAVMSSQIEGTHAGLQDVLEFEATQDAEGLPAGAHHARLRRGAGVWPDNRPHAWAGGILDRLRSGAAPRPRAS